jgi:hypothetical protein
MRDDPGRYQHAPGDGLRVYVEDSEPPVHDGATSVRVTLTEGDDVAEVQVALVGTGLVIIAAGDVHQDRDQRGFVRLRVSPNR